MSVSVSTCLLIKGRIFDMGKQQFILTREMSILKNIACTVSPLSILSMFYINEVINFNRN